MNNRSTVVLPRRRGTRPHQRGVVLLLALILLVVLTLAGLALVRSVSTNTMIAGNLSFKQSATHAGDVGIEDAITWLMSVDPTVLNDNVTTGSRKYLATRADPASNQTWAAYWDTLPATAINALPQNTSTGNTVSYVIQRLCASAGEPASSGCSVSPVEAENVGNSKGGGTQKITPDPQVYYRITARITGPRDTISFVQAVISL